MRRAQIACPAAFLLHFWGLSATAGFERSAFPIAQRAAVGNGSSVIFGSEGELKLSGSSPGNGVVVLDYKANVEGHPTFEVVSATGDTSRLEITYSETRPVLDEFYMSDGPIGLAAAMDSYRVNRYNITGPETNTNRLIQGGFRFQKLNLSTPGELVLRKVGVRPGTSNTPLTELPGYFESSDEELNRIWKVGARTIQMNDIPANSIPPFWEVSSEGSRVSSLTPQVLSSPQVAALMQYRVEFEVNPVSQGFGFSVLADTLNTGIYILCNVANGSVSAHFGTSELEGAPLASGQLPSNVTIGTFHRVSATVNVTEISVSIDGAAVLSFSQTSSFFGSFGLGASFGHTAVFRSLSATSLAGDPIYSSALTDESFLPDFLMGPNPFDTAVDGSKRDRIAYSGDLDVALGSSLASTNGSSYVLGTLNLIGSYQFTPGFFAPTAKIQQPPLATPIASNITGLIGYSFTVLTGAAQFYQQTGNTSFAREWAPKVARMLDWADSQVLSESGLMNISNPAFGGDWNYYDPQQSGAVAKFNMLYAYSLQECLSLLADGGVDTKPYATRLTALRQAINSRLWSDDLGAYFISESVRDAFGQDSNALAILAGVTAGIPDGSSRVLKSLDQLNTPKGPLAFSSGAVKAGFAAFISPYASAYHLRAALTVGNSAVATTLMKSLWGPMADPSGANYTGCFWETLDAAGGPALGRTTSLCHAWASGPTGELSRHVLGVSAEKPGYLEWKVAPLPLGLKWASGKIPIPGGQISVFWNSTDDAISRLEVVSPAGTKGVVSMPGQAARRTFEINGREVDFGNGTFAVNGGDTFVLVQNEGKGNAGLVVTPGRLSWWSVALAAAGMFTI